MAEPASCDLTHDLRRMKCVVRVVIAQPRPPPPPRLACLAWRVPADTASAHSTVTAAP